ncbi:MAG: aminotransferase class V-fold PLP-dependent enzyme [Gammaproteobacteria bacterium]|nr:aminotransferase class V-fold PLP-dependent enzyme [Gammaproteobacteria bacterium]
MMNSLSPLENYCADPAITYLRTAAQGLLPTSARAAMEAYIASRTGQEDGSQGQVYGACKRRLADLLGADEDSIAFVSSTSDACSLIYGLIDWRAGDNVVVIDDTMEFPSVTLPAHRLATRGVQVRVVRPEQWHVSSEAIAARTDSRTRLVFVSHVSYRSGFRLALPELASHIRKASGAWLAVDASQSLGVTPADARVCDFVVATAFKWMLGAHGAAVLYWNRERVPQASPPAIGWHNVVGDVAAGYQLKVSAERFEAGNPSYLSLFVLNASLASLACYDAAAIERHVLDLTGYLLEEISKLGLPLITPLRDERRAGIVSWLDERCEQTAQRLDSEHAVKVSGNAGRIRVAAHLYNSIDDIERLLRALHELQ